MQKTCLVGGLCLSALLAKTNKNVLPGGVEDMTIKVRELGFLRVDGFAFLKMIVCRSVEKYSLDVNRVWFCGEPREVFAEPRAIIMGSWLFVRVRDKRSCLSMIQVYLLEMELYFKNRPLMKKSRAAKGGWLSIVAGFVVRTGSVFRPCSIATRISGAVRIARSCYWVLRIDPSFVVVGE